MRDPVLDRPILAPWPYRRRKLRVAWPHFVYLAALLGTLVWGSEPSGGLVCSAIVVGLVLIAVILPLLRESLREIRAARAVRPLNLAAIGALEAGDGAEAERLLRRAWANPELGPPALAGIVHNLGMALLYQGDASGGQALMLHAHASGWMATFRYGWPQRPDARRDRAMIDVAYVLHQARAGAYAEALRVGSGLDTEALPADVATVTLLALALASGGPAEELLARAVPLPEGHWAWSRLGWPELVAFAREHGKLVTEVVQ